MKKIFYFGYIILSFLSCKKETNIVNVKQTKNDSIVTLIFEEPEILDTIWYTKSSYSIIQNPITYRKDKSFIDVAITPNKQLDTIKIESNSGIYLNYNYDFNYANVYYFEPGDVILFKYKKNIPYVENLNNKTKDYNHNTIFNDKNPINQDGTLFYFKNKRFKNFQELKNDSLEWIKRGKKQYKFFDSLKVNNIISPSDYQLNTVWLNNQKKLRDSNALIILKEKHNLSIVANTILVENAFEKISKPKLINISQGAILDFRNQFNNVLKLNDIDVNNRDYLLYYYVNNIAQNHDVEEIKKYFKLFEKEVNDKSLISTIKIKYASLFDKNKLDQTIVQLINKKSKSTILLDDLVKNNKGKIIYIDFWASWCAPCRVAMPASRKLQEEYKNKDVFFLYISIDTDLKKWEIASEKEKLHNNYNNNLLAINYPDAFFYKEMQLKTIPRYVIYDRKGKLVNKDAPSPETKEIRQELDSLLKL